MTLLRNEDAKEVYRSLCAESLAEFARRAWHVLEPATELKWGWALDSICEHLEAVTSGEIKRLLINVPPGTMKSLLTSVIWPAWEWGPCDRPSLRYLSTAHKEPLATRDNMRCRRLIQSYWFQNLWTLALTGDQNAKTKFENTYTGFRESMPFTSLTGSRGDRVIIDDPHSVDDANSSLKMAADISTFRASVPTRVNGENSAIVIIMQRLAVGDVSDVALELDYEHLKIPMRYAHTSRSVAGLKQDPRTEDEELMFPELFSESAVKALEKSLGTHGTAGQLAQEPNPKGGRIFKTECFKRHDVTPVILHRTIFADTAQKTAEKNDFSVFQHWGLGVDGVIYLLGQIRGKWEAPELERQALAFWAECKSFDLVPFMGSLRSMEVEDKASGTGLIQSIKKTVPVRAIQRAKDKYTRALDVLPLIETGRVSLPRAATFTGALIAEFESFSADGTQHDDQVDPMMDAIVTLLASPAPQEVKRPIGGKRNESEAASGM